MRAVSGSHCLGLVCAVVFVGSLNTIYQGSASGIGSHARGLAAKAPPARAGLIPAGYTEDAPDETGINLALLGLPDTGMEFGPFASIHKPRTPISIPYSSHPSYPSHLHTSSSPKLTPDEAAAEARRAELGDLIARCGRDYGVDRFLITAVIKVESNFNPGVVSPEGAQGLMQLMPDMAQEVGITDRLDPVQNVTGGTIYLARQLQEFQGDLPLALAAYNAGPSAVRKHGGIPPYQVTRNFVDKVIDYQRHFQRSSNVVPGMME